jgi:hypothetical protein
VYKWRMVLGGVAAASFLGTFAAGPALASTASPDRVPVVVRAAALPEAGVPIVPAPTGVVPAVGAATSALLNGVGNVVANLSGTLLPAVGPAVGGLTAPVDGIAQDLGNLAGLPAVGALLGSVPALPVAGALLGDLNNLVNGAGARVGG